MLSFVGASIFNVLLVVGVLQGRGFCAHILLCVETRHRGVQKVVGSRSLGCSEDVGRGNLTVTACLCWRGSMVGYRESRSISAGGAHMQTQAFRASPDSRTGQVEANQRYRPAKFSSAGSGCRTIGRYRLLRRLWLTPRAYNGAANEATRLDHGRQMSDLHNAGREETSSVLVEGGMRCGPTLSTGSV